MATTSFPRMYHVFLSFRGEDTRKTFTDHLYTALLNAGFRTFRDDNSLERGNNIQSELQRAIQDSRISIVVLSKDYASSSWCLDELAMILEWKRKRSATTSRHEVLPVFYSVDPSHVRNQKGSFEEAFVRYEERILKAEVGSESRNEWVGKVKRWRAALTEVADLAGMNLQNQADGHESNFIQKIVKVVKDKVSRTILSVAPYPIGIESRAQDVLFWLQNESVRAIAICGMGGIGKTTIAKFVYNLNFSRFEGSSFLANIRETSEQQNGLVRLQKQLFSDILKGRTEKIYNVDEGIAKLKDALYCRRVLLVLDDVDKPEQLDAILGMRDWFYPGSKVIITTRNEQLVRAREICKVYMVEALDNQESLKLLSWHTFGQDHPPDGYLVDSKRMLHHCGGLPLAIKVLGSSLVGKSLDIWKSQLEKLKVVSDNQIFEKLKMSYNSLQDDHDRDLFLHIACFFVGKDKDDTITILDGCDFYSMVGIQNLIDRCLLTVDEKNKLSMHQLLQDMGKEIVHQESPKEPGERSRLWNHKDSFNLLRDKTGTRNIEGLILDMQLLKRDNSARTVFGVNRKRYFEETFGKTLLSNLGNSLKRHCFGVFSWQPGGTIAGNSNEVAMETDAFSKMHKLKLLRLSYVQLSGSFESFPKGLRWLCWDGFPLKSIPNSFPLESLIALEMPHNNLKNSIWQGTKGLHSEGVFSTLVSGSKVPAYFHFKNTGSSVSFTVPSRLYCRIQGLGVCSVYALSNSSLTNSNPKFWGKFDITFSDGTGWLGSHHPDIFGVPEVDEDMLWLSFWERNETYPQVWQKFENQLEGDVELKFSVDMSENFLVKEVGARLEYEEEVQEQNSTPNPGTSEELAVSPTHKYFTL